MKLIAIGGSPRPGGNSNCLVEEALREAAGRGLETEKIILSQYNVSPCQGHDNCASRDYCVVKDDAGWILEHFREADGVILATPVYYFSVTAQMKAFLDRSYFLYEHEKKCRARAVGLIVVAAGEGIEDTFYTLRKYVADTFEIPDERVLAVSGYAKKLREVLKNEELLEAARNLGHRMAELLKG